MIHGSMRHYPSGKKKKTNYWTKPKPRQREFKKHIPETPGFWRETPQIPSKGVSGASSNPSPTPEYKKEVSGKYTVAPAYNKGGYQVIPRKEVEDIGK